MIEQYAIVTSCDNTQATLNIERRTACGICGQKSGCGNATWGKLLGHKNQSLVAENLIKANVGDSVVVGVDEQAMLKSVFFLYAIPLAGLLVGSVLATLLFSNELMVILGAVSGLIVSFFCVKHYLANSSQHLHNCQAVILRQVNDTE